MTPKTLIAKARSWATTLRNSTTTEPARVSSWATKLRSSNMMEPAVLLDLLSTEVERAQEAQRWISVDDEKPEEEQDVLVLIPGFGNPANGWCVPKVMRYSASIWLFEGEHWPGHTPHYWRPLGKVTP